MPPAEDGEGAPAPDAARLEPDAALNRERTGDAASEPVTAITVHVSGLTGSGLALSYAGDRQLTVPSDGTWKVPLPQPSTAVELVVSEQPVGPHQLCEVTKLERDEFSVICRALSSSVSGSIEGLAGKGLELTLYDDDGQGGQTDHVHAVYRASASGPFAFEGPLSDRVDYAVRVTAQPTEPRQTCVVENAAGSAVGSDIGNIKVSCATNTYVFTSVVSGLKGSGLTLNMSGSVYPVTQSGPTTYADAARPDGFHYSIEIASQPTNPNQLCYIEHGDGVIDGANVSYNVICDAAGNLRISEVGACPYSNSSCWFEITNAGAEAEQLAFYRLRTSGISPGAFVPSRVFTLPTITIPPFSQIVVAGKTASAMPDGQGVYHIAEGDTVPWWSSDGFLELLNPSGATASFVRFGANSNEPTTGGTWTGGEAPSLPRLNNAYGYSLQYRSVTGHLPASADDWSRRAFATYAGPNDVTSDVDDDRDGIPDSAEVPGGKFSGIDVYAMGARLEQRDVFVEIDHMAGGDPATTPRREALDKLVTTFARRNIALHLDVGSLFNASYSPQDHNLGGGNEVPFAQGMQLGPTDAGIADLYDYKAAHMEGRRRMVFYYLMFGWSQQKDGSGGSSGVGELPGNDALITLGGYGLTANSQQQRNLIANYQAASIMHELGHNFGLRHGGGDSRNRKPNYVSVMNYLYSPIGLPTIGNAEGDRYDYYSRCRLFSISQLTNSPIVSTLNFVLDYSNGTSADLDESALQESQGLGRSSSGAVDFNCNGQTDAPYARDLNGDRIFEVLSDNNDWATLDFVFRRSVAGAESGPSLLRVAAVAHEDPLTGDREHHTDEPCPAMVIPEL